MGRLIKGHLEGEQGTIGSWSGRDRRSVARPLDVMRDRLDRILTEFGHGHRRRSMDWDVVDDEMDAPRDPDIDIYRIGDTVVVRARLPGLTKEHVHVDVEADSLLISGELEDAPVEDPIDHHRSERNHSTFFRAIPLVEGADAEHCAAHFNNGVLEVEFQLPHDPKPKRTSIPID